MLFCALDIEAYKKYTLEKVGCLRVHERGAATESWPLSEVLSLPSDKSIEQEHTHWRFLSVVYQMSAETTGHLFCSFACLRMNKVQKSNRIALEVFWGVCSSLSYNKQLFHRLSVLNLVYSNDANYKDSSELLLVARAERLRAGVIPKRRASHTYSQVFTLSCLFLTMVKTSTQLQKFLLVKTDGWGAKQRTKWERCAEQYVSM